MSCIRPTIQYTRCSRMKRHEQKNDIQREETYDDESFKPNKPISLPSLENPPDVGPLYNTCRSVTGMEQQDANDDKDAKDEDVELILYNAGADSYKNDLIGKMNLEKETLKKRDKLVYDFCFNRGKNIVTVLGGGYAKNIKDTVDIYYNTFTESFNLWKNYRG